MTKIIDAECFELRPEDRNYNKHGKPRNAQMEILGHGVSYAIRTAIVYGVGYYMKNDFIEIHSTHGLIKGYEGDSVGITFSKSGNVHTPIMHDVSKTITTFCDHDIGAIVYG